ncbi:MAG: damage-inducible protein DinB [Bacteroidetes bacterium]|jgi:uncharacterized damage-inducible protein DinB|nr:damage-inducible protein DinB [Bacteroidota bacterium]
MTANYFIDLFDYDSTSNQRLLNLLIEIKHDKSRLVFAHLLAAKKIWLERLKGENTYIKVCPDLKYSECKNLIKENRKTYRQYLSKQSDRNLLDLVFYQNSKGKKFETPIRDILTHVLIHGGYHRGQIANYVRESGGEPINTDYITYVRDMQE